MATKVIMPELGESVDEATVTRWLKAEGEAVEEFEPLLEVNTDKVDTEIPSPTTGTLLKILVAEETLITAGTVLAWIGDPDEVIDGIESTPPMARIGAETNGQSQKAPERTAKAIRPVRPGRREGLGFISPVVARLASEHQLDLALITGTGKDNRITKRDVLKFLEQAPPQRALDPQPAAPAPSVVPGQIQGLSTMRKAIAAHMVMSKQTSPHVTSVMEADMSAVAAHRQANKADFASRGVKLTYTAYLIEAIVTACQAHPVVNSSWHEQGISVHSDINVGMATALERDGLIVPVIKQADSYSLIGLARTINDLADRARARQLKPDEVRGGTITLTNHGTSGSLFATPIINQPQCAIVGAGMIQKRVIVINDAIAIRPMVYLSMTFDHRILDGATADYFLGSIKKRLESFSD
jgi:2-oxoglutarate dehydrogenase E2 component (dihydrolipoamide succinyltransferase)